MHSCSKNKWARQYVQTLIQEQHFHHDSSLQSNTLKPQQKGWHFQINFLTKSFLYSLVSNWQYVSIGKKVSVGLGSGFVSSQYLN